MLQTAAPDRPLRGLPDVARAREAAFGQPLEAIDVMVDLETLGKGPGCAILSIGAVAFNPITGLMGAGFYTVVSTASCRALGLREDADTVSWWGQQSPDARRVLAEAEASATTVADGLDAFGDYLKLWGGPRSVRVWGNGADFDNAILASLYHRVGKDQPWAFWNSRCFRTLKNLRLAPEPDRAGVHHNALDDARHQAAHAIAIHQALKAGRA